MPSWKLPHLRPCLMRSTNSSMCLSHNSLRLLPIDTFKIHPFSTLCHNSLFFKKKLRACNPTLLSFLGFGCSRYYMIRILQLMSIGSLLTVVVTPSLGQPNTWTRGRDHFSTLRILSCTPSTRYSPDTTLANSLAAKFSSLGMCLINALLNCDSKFKVAIK